MVLRTGQTLARHTATEENIAIIVDPTLPADPQNAFVIATQTQATAVGAFKNAAAAIDSLPDNILHEISILFVDGDHTLDGRNLGNLERFRFMPQEPDGQYNYLNGKIIYASQNGLVRIAGTNTYAVASSTERQIVLATDPGFSANQYRGKFVRVVSGTGAGQVRALRDHATTTFNLPGKLGPLLDATSIVEFVEPAARLQDGSAGWPGIRGKKTFNWTDQLQIKELEFYTNDAGGYFAIDGLGVQLSDCILKFPAVVAGNCDIWLSGVVFDGQGMQSWGAGDPTGLLDLDRCGAWTSDARGALFRNSPGHGMLVGGVTGEPAGTSYHAMGFVMDDLDGDGVRVSGHGNSFAMYGTNPGNIDCGSTVLGYAVQVTNGARIYLNSTLLASTFPTGGALGSLAVDGSPISIADIQNAPDETVIGGRGSVVSTGVEW